MIGVEELSPQSQLATDPLVGQVIDQRYRIESLLGRGGMGQVWRVTHLESLQQFALKTLHPPLAADPRVVARFIQEARAAGGLKSRHVVRIIDARANYVHEHRSMPFVVMELLEGDSLEAFLFRSGRLSIPRTLWLAKQLVLALDAIHAAGIVHRDLKPSNVFLAYDDDQQLVVKLCDFGLAKVTQGAAPLAETGSGEILGTPLYMAPEQLRSVKQVGPATDLWAFGLLIFRALSGEDYFGRCTNTADLIVAVLQQPLIAPSRRTPGFPPALDRWFLKACALAPEQRFTSAKELFFHLDSALGKLEPESIHASHLLRAEREPELPRKGTVSLARGQLSTTKWLALTLLPLAAIGAYLGLGVEPSRDDPQAATQAAIPATAAVAAGVPTTVATIVVTATATASAIESSVSPSPEPAAIAGGRSSLAPSASQSNRPHRAGRAAQTPPPPAALSTRQPEPPTPAAKRPGEVCSRSSECQSGVCLAAHCR